MNKKSASILAVAMAGSFALSACGGGGGSSDDKSGGGSNGSAGSGGTLYYLSKRPAEHLDPQRMYIGRDIANMGRLTYRSLVQMPVTEDAAKADKPVADLATDTGKMKDGGKSWSFTLKDGVKWEDGKEISCADLKYGLSRTFATDVITGGPNYAIGFLDVPQDSKGLPTYKGPYSKTGQADFDKAVTCDGKTITYKFNKAWPDFNLAVASLRAFDPYRQDKDKGPKNNYAIFSNGPYKLDGTWKKGTGGTFVRNDKYDAKTDGVRKALPDKIVFVEGLTNEVITQRLVADSGKDKNAVTDRSVPPAMYSQAEAAKSRAATPDSPYVDYVVPNFKKLTNPKVRQALLASTDAQGWITAGGGDKAYAPAYSIINPALTSAYVKNPAFKYGTSGDPAAAKKLMKESGEKLPYSIKFTYSQSPTADKQAAALAAGWQRAGFKVDLNPLTDTYYDVIQSPNSDADVVWGGWGADWPSASTVLPALFDSRINLTEKSNGQDYGNYKSDEVNKMIDEAGKATSVDAAGEIYKKIDKKLGEDVAYIPLEITKFYMLRGSNVTNYIDNPATSMYPDLGSVGVKK